MYLSIYDIIFRSRYSFFLLIETENKYISFISEKFVSSEIERPEKAEKTELEL